MQPGKYKVLVADCPWPYIDKGRRGASDKHYKELELQKLIDLEVDGIPVRDLAAKNCILFFWVTNSFLIDGSAARIVEAWGFVPKALHTWVKIAKNQNLRIGVGDYGRNTTEHFIIARRGKPKLAGFWGKPAIPTSHYWDELTDESHRWPWQPKHSRKPAEFYALVDRACPYGPKFELFSRVERDGWDVHGDQVEKSTHSIIDVISDHGRPAAKKPRRRSR